MPFVEVPVEDAKEPEIVPEGEYEVRCESATEKRNRDDTRDLIVVSVAIMNPPDGCNPQTLFHQIALPNENDSDRGREFMLLNLRRFLECFHVPFEGGGFNTDDIPGSSGKCRIGLEEVIREGVSTGEKRNVLVLPRLKAEAGPVGKKKKVA